MKAIIRRKRRIVKIELVIETEKDAEDLLKINDLGVDLNRPVDLKHIFPSSRSGRGWTLVLG